MAKKGGLSEDFLDRNLPGRKKIKPEDVAVLKSAGEGEEPEGEVAPAKPAEAAPAAPEKPAETPAAAPEKPAEAKPAAAPEKPAEAPAAPAAATPAKPADSVPVHVYTDTRAELKAERERRAQLEKDLEEARKPKEVKAKEPEDPEPDAKTHPIEHDQWEIRELKRTNTKLAARVEEIAKGATERTEAETRQAARVQFDTGIDKLTASHRSSAQGFEAIPDIDDRIAFLRAQLFDEYKDLGYSEEDAKWLAEKDEFDFKVGQVQQRKDPIIGLARLANHRGYKPKEAAPAAAPAAKTDAEKLKDAKAREDAAKSAGTFPGAPPRASDSEQMDVNRWAKMSPKEKREYKKKYGDPVPKFMGSEEAAV